MSYCGLLRRTRHLKRLLFYRFGALGYVPTSRRFGMCSSVIMCIQDVPMEHGPIRNMQLTESKLKPSFIMSHGTKVSVTG